jgi:hypothetical protein
MLSNIGRPSPLALVFRLAIRRCPALGPLAEAGAREETTPLSRFANEGAGRSWAGYRASGGWHVTRIGCPAAPATISQGARHRCHLVECFINKIKDFRRVAMRYDKTTASFFAFVAIASFMVWLR